MIYKLIDTNLNQCINTIEWDGVIFNQETGLGWNPPANTVAIQSDIIQIGDSVQMVNNIWQKV